MEKRYLGIDIGGMSIKGMLVDESGTVYAEGTVPTDSEKGGSAMCDNIASLVSRLMEEGKTSEVCAIGVGCPGVIDSKNGVVVFAGNLSLENFPLAAEITKRVNIPCRITNDANAAALGEAKFGAGKQYEDSILVTLGTGVGGGIVIGGKLFEGGKSAGAEIGHMVIVENGRQCTCGRKGCYERYASARALMEQTREAMEAHPESAMWEQYNLETVSGKTPFEYRKTDATAKSVVETYVKHLACGIVNLANIFRPQVIMLGGGVSAQGEVLTAPVQEIVDREMIGGCGYAPVKVVTATLGNRAGAYGAASFVME